MNMPANPAQWRFAEADFELPVADVMTYDRLLNAPVPRRADLTSVQVGGELFHRRLVTHMALPEAKTPWLVQQSIGSETVEVRDQRAVMVSGLLHLLVGLAIIVWTPPQTVTAPLTPMAMAWVETPPTPLQPRHQPKPISRAEAQKPVQQTVKPVPQIAHVPQAPQAELAIRAETTSAPAASSRSAALAASSDLTTPVAEFAPVDVSVAYLNNPPPPYPSLSRRAGEQGEVRLKVYVTPEGRVAEVEISRSSGFSRLDIAAREAVQGWRFTPAHRGSERMSMWVIVPIRFQLTA